MTGVQTCALPISPLLKSSHVKMKTNLKLMGANPRSPTTPYDRSAPVSGAETFAHHDPVTDREWLASQYCCARSMIDGRRAHSEVPAPSGVRNAVGRPKIIEKCPKSKQVQPVQPSPAKSKQYFCGRDQTLGARQAHWTSVASNQKND